MAALLLSGGIVASMDPAVGTLARGDVLIDDDTIRDVGPAIPAPDGAEIIDASGSIVMPGFVNAHIHTWQTALRGIAADWTIQEYLRAMHAGLATHFTPDDIYLANLAGALHQIDCGTTTIVDWCHNNPTPDHTNAAIDGLEEAGIRALFLHGSPKPDPKPGDPHFSEIPMPRSEVARLRKGRLASDDRLVTLGLAILGPGMSLYDVAKADLALAREFGLRASMHVTGRLLVPDGFERLCTETDLIGPWANLVHANGLGDKPFAMALDRGATFTVTPEVEMQMGFGRPVTSRLRARGAPVSLGSDVESAMSSDMFGVARFALQAARFVDSLDAIAASGSGPASITIKTAEALRWATLDGAAMAGLERKVGSLTPGKKADVVMLRDVGPVHAAAATVVLQAGPRNVDTVIINGRIRKRAGVLTGSALESTREALRLSGERIVSALRPH